MSVVILNYNEVKDISTCTNDFRGKSAIMINLVSDFEVKIYEFNYLVFHKRKTIKHIFSDLDIINHLRHTCFCIINNFLR